MAIEKKLIHFKKWSDFSSKKLSANEQNTQYTLGVDGALTTGAPDVLYQSICWIKDVKKMWTHGTLYDCSGGGGVIVETDPIFSASPAATITAGKISAWDGKQDAISDLDIIRRNALKGAAAVQPEDIPIETYIADFTMDSLKSGMKNGNQVDCDMQALITAMNANKVILVREGEDSSYKGVYVLNGYAEDLLYFSIVDTSGNILWCNGTDYNSQFIDGQTLRFRSWADKQDALVSGNNIKTINGESIVGSGDITITGGSGTITGVSANGTSIATSGVANIPAASTSKYGVTKLTTLTNSSSTTLAATASAVKSAYDLAASKASMSDVNTAIANAITNAINASY